MKTQPNILLLQQTIQKLKTQNMEMKSSIVDFQKRISQQREEKEHYIKQIQRLEGQVSFSSSQISNRERQRRRRVTYGGQKLDTERDREQLSRTFTARISARPTVSDKIDVKVMRKQTHVQTNLSSRSKLTTLKQLKSSKSLKLLEVQPEQQGEDQMANRNRKKSTYLEKLNGNKQ